MAEPVIRRNKVTGEVAVQVDGAWEIFPNEEAAMTGLMVAAGQKQQQEQQPEQSFLARGNQRVNEFLQGASGTVEEFLSPHIGETAASITSGLIPQSTPELAGMAALMAIPGGGLIGPAAAV